MHGIFLFLFAFPSGWLADRFSRQFVLRIAGVLGLVSIGVSLAAFSWSSIALLYVIHGMWGAYNGLFAPSIDSLFADSVKKGMRSDAFAWKHMVQLCGRRRFIDLLILSFLQTTQAGSCVGPIISIIMLYSFGNEWKMEILLKIIIVGLFLGIVPITTLFFMSDKDSLVEEKEVKKEVLPQPLTGVIESREDAKPEVATESDPVSPTLERHRVASKEEDGHLDLDLEGSEDTDRLLPKEQVAAEVNKGHTHTISSRYVVCSCSR